MLEDELYRLYHLITVKEELQTLQFENEILRDIMARHSIALPANVPLQEPAWAEVTFTSDGGDGQGQYLQVKLPECQSLFIAQGDQQLGADAHTSSHNAQLTAATMESSESRYGTRSSITFNFKTISNQAKPETKSIITAA